jgi:putative flippase GtrA
VTKLFRQIPKFFAVGGGATAVHVAAALAFNGLAGVTPLWANVLAFLVASGVSYLGNWFWTFDGASRRGRRRRGFSRCRCLALLSTRQSFTVVEWLAVPVAGHDPVVSWFPPSASG